MVNLFHHYQYYHFTTVKSIPFRNIFTLADMTAPVLPRYCLEQFMNLIGILVHGILRVYIHEILTAKYPLNSYLCFVAFHSLVFHNGLLCVRAVDPRICVYIIQAYSSSLKAVSFIYSQRLIPSSPDGISVSLIR